MQSDLKEKIIKINRGVSLLETVVYVAILASLSLVVVNTLLSLSLSFSGIRLSKEIHSSAVTALGRITSEIKKAKSIDQTKSVWNTNPSVLALATTDDSGNQTTVLFSVINGALHITKGGLDIGALTAADVAVSNFTVGFIDTGRSNAATVTLGLTGIRGKITISDTFRTAAVTRNQ